MTIPQGYKQTELGIIPEDWEVKTIASLGNIVGGGTPSTIIPAYWDGGIQWFTPAEIGASKYISKSERSISKLGLRSSAARILPKDAILLTTRASIGLSAILLNEATTNQGFQSIIVNTNHCNEYAYYALKTKVSEMLTLASGSTFAEISKAKLASIKLPIPPIAEQGAIAEVLSDVDGLIAALDKKIAKKRLLKQGAMQQLLTGKKRLPGFTDEWIKCELLTVCNVLDNKRVPLNDEQRTSGIYPYCGANGIVDYIDRYIFDEDLILIAEDGGNFDQYETRPIAYWMSGKYWVNNHAHVLKAKNEYNQRYIFYQLEHKDITDYIVGGTRTKLTRAQLDKIEISIPSTYAEQQAIATILSDMDKEIADLEAQRDKYRLLKSGMMQKLLTGQIRLVKQQKKIIPLGVEVPAVREIPIDAHIIAGHIVNRSHQSRGWGRTKLQKSLHLIGYCAQLNLGNEYIRNTAGPDDQQLMNHIDQKFRQYRHVNKVCEKLPDGRTHYSYTPTPMIQDVEMAYEKYPKELREQIDALIDKLNTMDLAGAEAVSTLYAVWNNRIIKQEQITDNLLIADFYAWSKHKADFEEARVRKALNYMRDNNIIPVGWGKYIDKG